MAEAKFCVNAHRLYRVVTWWRDEEYPRVLLATSDERRAEEWARDWLDDPQCLAVEVVQVRSEGWK